jgi:hypothetical protein
MYESFGAMWRTVERNPLRIQPAGLMAGLQVALASILLASWLPVLILLLRAHLPLRAAAFAVIPSLVLMPWYGNVLSALGAPFAIYAYEAMLINAWIKKSTGP